MPVRSRKWQPSSRVCSRVVMKEILKRWRVPVAGGLLFLCAIIALGVIVSRRKTASAQPIAFNHKLHAATLGLECGHCHQGVETGVFATLPKAEICLACHAAPLSENPEEAKVREYGEKGEIPWHRLTRVPDHVYFSHQRHVKFGQVSCETCHGKMTERTRPPSSAPMELSMNDCLDCHRRHGASIDCVSCHR